MQELVPAMLEALGQLGMELPPKDIPSADV